MAGIYSRVLVQTRVASADSDAVIYTPPVGLVVVVRDIVLTPATPSGTTVGVWVDHAGSPPAYIYSVLSLTQWQTYHWDGRQVIGDGDVLRLTTVAGDCQCRISGYVLGE